MLLEGSAHDQPNKYGCTLPRDHNQGVITALLPDGEFPFASRYTNIQMAATAVLLAADLIQTAQPPLANLNVPAVRNWSDGAGSASDQLWSLMPWFAAIRFSNGSAFDQPAQLVRHTGQFLAEYAGRAGRMRGGSTQYWMQRLSAPARIKYRTV